MNHSLFLVYGLPLVILMAGMQSRLVLCIIIDGIVQNKFKKIFQFQSHKRLQSELFGGDAGGSGRGISMR